MGEEQGKEKLFALGLSPEKLAALQAVRQRLFKEFAVEKIILFGSTARGEADEESDIDLLVITKHPFSRWQRHEITDAICDINLKYKTNLSTLVVDTKNWNEGLISYLPIHENILQEGIPL